MGTFTALYSHGALCWPWRLVLAVVTTVHDCQLLEEDIDPDKMLEHDVPVDIIVTPTQVLVADSASSELVAQRMAVHASHCAGRRAAKQPWRTAVPVFRADTPTQCYLPTSCLLTSTVCPAGLFVSEGTALQGCILLHWMHSSKVMLTRPVVTSGVSTPAGDLHQHQAAQALRDPVAQVEPTEAGSDTSAAGAEAAH